MSKKSTLEIAQYYCVSDVPGAIIPSARLSVILESMFLGRPLSEFSLKYLQDQNLLELHLLATHQIAYEGFIEASGRARKLREQTAEAQRLANEERRVAQEAEWEIKYRQERDAAEAARVARERDPQHIARGRNRALREKYDVGFIDQAQVSKVMALIRQIDSGVRLGEVDFAWLDTIGKEYFTDTLRRAHHQCEAEYFASEYARNQDPWNAVNASGHFRKCGQPASALEILTSLPPQRLSNSKIKSATCTTRGGAMRDLGRLNEAHKLGEEGHKYMPKDFRPCTLLGAVNMELGNFVEARDWYAKAEERGASLRAIDSDLRGIFMRADAVKREAIKAFLFAENPVRYAWVNKPR